MRRSSQGNTDISDFEQLLTTQCLQADNKAALIGVYVQTLDLLVV